MYLSVTGAAGLVRSSVRLSGRAALASGVALGVWAQPAIAQQAAAADAQEAQPAPPAAASARGADGNEIIVTATKRDQTLQSVPVAVTVTSAATIERAEIRDIIDLSTVVSSLKVDQHESSTQTNFLIRGFGNGANNAGIEPSVGVFVDGVYRSRSAAQIADFPDIERIEVLRGPQSTLFGKNASAGVISIVTREPQFKFGANAEATYGNYNAVVLKGAITGPVSQDLALSLAGGYNRRDGYDHDLGTGDATGNRNRWFIRGQALYQPTSQLKIRLIGDYDYINELCCGVVNLLPSASTAAIQALGGNVNAANNSFGNVVYDNFDSTNKIKNFGGSGQVDYSFGPIKATSITAWRESHSITNQDADFTSADLLGRLYQDLRIRTFTQELRLASSLPGPVNFLVGGYYLGEHIDQANTLQYGTQFRPYADLLIRGATANAFNVASLEAELGSLQGNPALYTGKFFANGEGQFQQYGLSDHSISAFGQVDFKPFDRLTLTGGVNYTHDGKRFTTNVTSTDVFSAIDLTAARNAATNAGIAQTIGGILGVPGGFASPAQIGAFAAGNPAAYGQISAGAANATAPLLGLKALQLIPPFLNLPNAVEPGRTNDGNVSYTARASFNATRQVNVYLNFSTGFKASSINLSRDSRPALADMGALATAGLLQTNQSYGSRFAGPEKSTLYEGGLKANWGLVTFNLAVFKEIIRGFQSELFTGTGFFLANAGKESEFGIEAEGTARPTSELTLSAGLTYLDPKYDSFVLSSVGDLSGTTPAGIPPITFNAAVENNHEFGNGDRLIVRGDWHFESKVQMVEGLPGFDQTDPVTGAVNFAPAIAEARMFTRQVSEFDASITYVLHHNFELSAWGRNLSNDRHLITIFDSPAQTGSVSGYTNQPRTYGVTARAKW